MDGGGRTPTRYPSFIPTIISSIILILIIISLCHHTTSFIQCYHNYGPWDNINDIDMNPVDFPAERFCTTVYVIDGPFATRSRSYTYADVRWEPECDVQKRCEMRRETYPTTKSVLHFVCCCNTPLCNNPIADIEMNPLVQYEKQLKANGAQACFVRYDKSAIQDCTRITNQKETTKTPSRCLSVRRAVSGEQMLGCAHDGTVDRCDWATDQDGSCRINPQTDNIECCCEGAYCNGDAYMNLICRHTYVNGSHFKYGGGDCAAPLPSTISTTTTDTTDTWMIVALVCASVLLLVCCVLLFTCVVCCLQRKYLKEAGRNDGNNRHVWVSTITGGSSASVFPRKPMTPSEKLDAEPPRMMIGARENEANVRAMGPQSKGKSGTMDGVVSNWGSVHTVLPPPQS